LFPLTLPSPPGERIKVRGFLVLDIKIVWWALPTIQKHKL